MIDSVQSFLVHPSKHAEQQPVISGTQIPHEGRLYEMLSSVFARAPQECNIGIQFLPDGQGRAQNECRSLVVDYTRGPNVTTGRAIAQRLQSITTHRSGLGLLFLMKGRDGDQHIAVISRFPADQGIVAQEHAQQLSVEFIERVFMKSAKAYKSVFYRSDSFERGFWQGHAVDRQITSGPRELSDYWIRDFLSSELLTTGAAGTKRLAVALREAARGAGDLDIKQELVAAATLLRGQAGQTRSARQFIERVGLSAAAVAVVEKCFAHPTLLDEQFQLDREEFDRHAQYRAVHLDNGALLVAEDATFDGVFHEELVAGDRRIRYTTEGQVVSETLRNRK